MRKLTTIFVVLALAGVAWASPSGITPYQGIGSGFILTVTDTDIDTAFEIVNADTGYVPLSTDTTVTVAFAKQSLFDSLRSGKTITNGSLTAAYTMASTADQSANNNFFQDRSTGTVAFVASAFSSAASPRNTSASWGYLIRQADADFKLGATWAIAVWSTGKSPGNPGLGTVQTAFSVGHSGSVVNPGPQQLRLDYLPTGQLSVVYSGAYTSGIDSVVGVGDKYDGLPHLAVFSLASSVLSLKIDNLAAVTKALSKNLSPLGAVDTPSVLSTWRGENDFRGTVDEVYIAEDAITMNAEMQAHMYQRQLVATGASNDTGKVWISGIKRSDSTWVSPRVSFNKTTPGVTTVNMHALEWVWTDTTETEPIIVYSTASTPRQAVLDSIPSGQRHAPIAHVFFGRDDTPVLEKVIFTNLAANAVTYELRVYTDVGRAISYTNNYYVLCAAYMASGGGSEVFDFGQAKLGGGVRLSQYSYIAAFAKGASANSSGTVNIVGQRRAQR
jgi:hypothetical protein